MLDRFLHVLDNTTVPNTRQLFNCKELKLEFPERVSDTSDKSTMMQFACKIKET